MSAPNKTREPTETKKDIDIKAPSNSSHTYPDRIQHYRRLRKLCVALTVVSFLLLVTGIELGLLNADISSAFHFPITIASVVEAGLFLTFGFSFSFALICTNGIILED